MQPFHLNLEQVRRLNEDGYLIIENLFDEEEIKLLRLIAKADRTSEGNVRHRKDSQDGIIKLTVRYEMGEDIYSAIVRCNRIVGPMEKLIGGDVFHYHHKLIFKEALDGGAWEWHQDYGYWYDFGFLYPDMASCTIAIDKATKENGCLQVVKGSHLLGRIDHNRIGDQRGADMERVHATLNCLDVEFCELAAGSAVFFHANLLHRSDQNKSPAPRWSFICCYSAEWNKPFKAIEGGHYSLLEKGTDAEVKEIGNKQWIKMQQFAQ